MVGLGSANSNLIGRVDQHTIDIEVVVSTNGGGPFQTQLHSSFDDFWLDDSQPVDVNKSYFKLFAEIYRVAIGVTQLDEVCPRLPCSGEVFLALIIDDIHQVFDVFAVLDLHLQYLFIGHFICFLEVAV